eukprot:1061917-Rhodomonas_salina.1
MSLHAADSSRFNSAVSAMQNHYGAAVSSPAPARRGPQLAFAFAIIAAALVCAVGIISYAKYTNALQPVAMVTTKLGDEFMVSPAGALAHMVQRVGGLGQCRRTKSSATVGAKGTWNLCADRKEWAHASVADSMTA